VPKAEAYRRRYQPNVESRIAVIVEIVYIDLPVGTKRADALALYRRSAGGWLSNPELIEKYYFFDEERHLGGGIYIWPTCEAARRGHGEDYVRWVQSVYGAPPRIQILDALLHVDPIGKRTQEF
jgi:hypothetical protein